MDLAGHLGRLAGGKQDAEIAARLVAVVSGAAAGTETFQQVLIENLTAALKPEITPAWSPALEGALRALVSSRSGGITGAVLPLIVRWDKNQMLTAAIKPRIADLTAQLTDAGLPDDRRAQVAINLLGVRSLDSSIIPAVAGVLASGSSSALQRRVVDALGNTAEPEAGAALVAALPRLPSELVEPAFAQIVRRADWSMALLESVRGNRVPLSLLGPASIHRLRTHSDKAVSDRAIAVVEEIRGPEVKEKDALIARFSSAVEGPGDLENGKKLFAANCASCHKFKGEGRDLAPDLTGMGAHGAHDLLVHILDPNRVVEPNFVAVSIETKDDQSMDGVVMRENSSTITLRNATTDIEIPVSNVKSRRSTGLSLMPNGYEALEANGLRDLIGYLCADENRFRVLDMTLAFTANSTRGIYASQESANESLRFAKFGLTKVDGVPFEVIHPTRSQTGNNVVVLKGGSGFSRTLPSKVEFKAGVAASALHFLGGVGGWAFPCCGENKNEGMPVAKVTLHFAGGGTEEMILKNGVEFADYNGRAEVPGSKEVPGLVRYGQVRWFSKPVAKQDVIERITLEGYDNAVAPTFVAITAELAGQKAAAAAPQASSSSGGIRALIVGGGSSHDFQRWFNLADAKTLEASGAKVTYTEKVDSVLPALPNIDVLYLSNNQPMPDPALRKGIFEFAEAGRGLLLIHPALWYNWRDWPEYNRVLVGGGSRSHDKYGEFEVTVTEPNHPIMAGVPGRFKITDELYRVELDPAGTPIQVLATGYEVGTQKTYPILWVVKHPKARIVCNTLGHDGLAHDHPAYKQILQNSLKWAASGAR
jgi:putative heme-binding domain-containing protein